MTEVILGQLRFILWMMCGGMAILAGYDVLRLFRWLVPHGAVWIAVEDLFFWGAASVPAFILFLKMHDGQIRWYGVVALLSGIVLYEVGISRPVRRVLCRIFAPIRTKLRRRCAAIFRKRKRTWPVLYLKLRSTVAFSRQKSSKNRRKF